MLVRGTECVLSVFKHLAWLVMVVQNVIADERPSVAEGTSATTQSSLLNVDKAVLAAQSERVAVMRKAAEATVAIFGLDGGGGGSGVLVTPDGYALTNYHVSSACGDHMRCGLNDGLSLIHI